MIWSYKTVVFELKKEGFLGSAFLDETEMEESLNEYGAEGWELISTLEMQDGLIAIFKKPALSQEEPFPEKTMVSDAQAEPIVAAVIEDIVPDAEPESVTDLYEDASPPGGASGGDDDDDDVLQSIRIE